ncbi:MAG: bifunctional DNA-formamidopyrimidine glycosylase/DNA-(apurinic or apyrimidinic site) lyase [Alphaproteobacteria bacterium]|nr:bifunctional DNA-formamidopyrimidine glycosylase/DNA-(apurinic or apyrimidinic site) lyase [Alphaproteobacteria bacterium]
MWFFIYNRTYKQGDIMPELPEVETIKSALQKSIGNAHIEDVWIRNNRLRELVPNDLADKIKGTTIKGYDRRAKYIVIYLSNNLSLIWHMGMSGKILLVDELPSELKKHDHIIIKTSNGYIIYNDPRRFGMFSYCESDKLQEHKLFYKMGIEPFDKKLDAKFLLAKLKNKKVPIKAALLDQEIITGIGNIYASEALFDAKISPLRPAYKINESEAARIIISVKKILEQAIAAGGSTLRDYEKPDGNLGYFQNKHCVYNKRGLPCPNCTCNINKSGGIQKVVIGGRSTFYCPQKQK